MSEVSPHRWVELRVHGVSGTPPYVSLEVDKDAPLDQVAGDTRSQFFRRRSDDPAGDASGRVLEAFQWSKYTSGSTRNTAWLLLLPFGVINAAQFMLYRPRPPDATILARALYLITSAWLRLLGLLLTLTLVLGVSVISMDLVAWQAVGDGRSTGWLATSVLVPVILLAFLIWLGSADITDDKTQRPARSTDEGPDGEAQPPTDFVLPGFYAGRIRSPSLWLIHVAGSFALLWLITSSVSNAAEGASQVALGLTVVLVLVLGDPEGSASVNKTSTPSRWTAISRLVVQVAVLALVVISAVGLTFTASNLGSSGAVHEAETMPGIDSTALILVTAVLSSLVVFAVAVALLGATTRTGAASGHRPSRFSRYVAGNLATITVGVGTWIGVGLTASLVLVARLVINVVPGEHVDVPEVVERVSYAWGLTGGVIVLAIAVVLVDNRRRRDHYAQRATGMFEQVRHYLDPRERTKIASGMYRARLKNAIFPVLGAFFVLGTFLAITGWLEMVQFTWQGGIPSTWLETLRTCESDRPGCAPSNAFLWLSGGESTGRVAGVIMWTGAISLIIAAIALIALGLWSAASPERLRTWMIVWDILSFWPRSAHPGVPPPYSLRVVRDLADRISWHLNTPIEVNGQALPPAGAVVLCGHSQGSLISYAALLELPPADRSRVGFVTFGSQLRLIFPRAFPSYVNYSTAHWILDAYGGRWVNLFRETDPIAGPVLSWQRLAEGPDARSLRLDSTVEPVPDHYTEAGIRQSGRDWRLLDPLVSDLGSGKLHLAGHSAFFLDPAWSAAVETVRPHRGDPAATP